MAVSYSASALNTSVLDTRSAPVGQPLEVLTNEEAGTLSILKWSPTGVEQNDSSRKASEFPAYEFEAVQSSKVTHRRDRKSRSRNRHDRRKPPTLRHARVHEVELAPLSPRGPVSDAPQSVKPIPPDPDPVPPGPTTLQPVSLTFPTIDGGILNGKAISLTTPVYPFVARTVHVSGTVEIRLTGDEQGLVLTAVAISGHMLLRGAALSAARGSRFTPATLDGKRARMVGIMLYEFILD
jgi:hypothetical protein